MIAMSVALAGQGLFVDVRPVQAVPPTTVQVTPGDAAPGELQPGIQYEEAMAHEADQIAFEPGDRVSVGFRPRGGDTWPIAGHAPKALPAGNATGREMAAALQGSRWAVHAPGEPAPSASPADAPTSAAPPAPPVDAPTVDPADVQPAGPASAVAPSTLAPSSPANAGLLRQVFGFLPYWEVSDPSVKLTYDVLSTIAYFSVGSDASGNLLKRNADGTLTTGWAGWTSARMTSVINTAHQRRTRVVLTLSVFAWSSAQAAKQTALLGSATARLNLARQAAAAVRDRGADGINLDFEPIASGYADEFTAFVRTVRAELNKIAPGYQLTFDTTGYIGNYPLEAATAAGGADAVFIMGYDYRTAGANPVGSIAPLTGAGYDITDTVRAYVARVPASKVILGVPYYGRAWSTTSSALHSTNQSGAKYGGSTTILYSTAVDYAAQYGRQWDAIEQSPWLAYRRENCTATYGCVTSWREIYYDDRPSLAAKYDLINRYALRGVGIWALGYDGARTELNTLLAAKFLHDTTAPLVGIRTMAPRQRDGGFRVSWLGEDISGITAYDVQSSTDGGAWTPWLTGTTQTSDIFLATAGHGYDMAGDAGPRHRWLRRHPNRRRQHPDRPGHQRLEGRHVEQRRRRLDRRWAGHGRWLHLVAGQRATPRMAGRRRDRRGRVGGGRTGGQPVDDRGPRPEQHARRPGTARFHGRRRLFAGLLAERRRPARHDPADLDEHLRARRARPQGPAARRLTRNDDHAGSPRRRAAGVRVERHRRGAAGCRRPVHARAERDDRRRHVLRPVAEPRHPGAARRVRRHGRHAGAAVDGEQPERERLLAERGWRA